MSKIPIYFTGSNFDELPKAISINAQMIDKYLFVDDDFTDFVKDAIELTALTRHMLNKFQHAFVACHTFSDLYNAWRTSNYVVPMYFACDIASASDEHGVYNSERTFLFAIPFEPSTDKRYRWSDFYDNQDDIDKHIANELERMGELCNLVWQSFSWQADSKR